MASSRSKNAKARRANQVSTLAKSLAPKEICAGDYVAVLHIVFEFPALVWVDDFSLIDYDEMIRLPFIPNETGAPLRVKAVCLPFVLVKHPCGKHQTLDVRHHRLAKIDQAYAKLAIKAHQSKKKKRKQKKKKAC